MKNQLVPVILSFLLWSSTLAQPNIQWQKSFGGSDNDIAFDIQLTYDGGFIIAGGSFSNDIDVTGNHGGEDYWIVKIDSIGNLQWQKSLGGFYDDEPYSIIQTSDSGYIVAGTSRSNDGDVTGHHGWTQIYDDWWLVKLDPTGNIQWQKSYGGSNPDLAFSIIQLPDQKYIVSGCTSSNDGDVIGFIGADDYWILKLDTSGNILWQKIFGDSFSERSYSIKQTSDRGFVATGFTSSNNIPGFHGTWGKDIWVIKLDSVGNLLWQKCLGGINFDLSYSIEVLSDNGFVVAGSVQSVSGDITNHNGASDYWIVRLDSTGNILWQKALGGSYYENAYSVSKTNDGGFVVAGLSASNDSMVTGHQGNGDFWIVKLDSTGNMQWQKCLGGTASDEAKSIKETSDGGFIIAGNTLSNDGDVLLNNGLSDYWIVKLASDTVTNILTPETHSFITVAPNPFTTEIFITFQKMYSDRATLNIRNIIGQVVFTKHKNHLTNRESIDLSLLSQGVYFLEVITEGERIVKKVVKE